MDGTIYGATPPVGRPKDKPENPYVVATPPLRWGRDRKGWFQIISGGQPLVGFSPERARRLALAILESDPVLKVLGIETRPDGRRALHVGGTDEALGDCFWLLPFEGTPDTPSEAAKAAQAVARAGQDGGEA